MRGRELVLGGARSGKSAHAQARAETAWRPVRLIVTAQARDDEMAARIARHRAERPRNWEVVEAPFDLPEALSAPAGDRVVLVDCLTLWLSNLLCEAPHTLAERCDALLAAIAVQSAPTILVSNEVGFGIVPDNALARTFRDEAGRLHQRLARVCERVTLVVAGLPLTVKE